MQTRIADKQLLQQAAVLQLLALQHKSPCYAMTRALHHFTNSNASAALVIH
jgi:hypothetical protein